MRVLFVWPGADFSVWDVGQGYRDALIRAGVAIRDYFVTRRMSYHAAAMRAGGLPVGSGDDSVKNLRLVAKQACENVVVEALYHRADLVVICCGLNFHPAGLQLLRATKIRTAIVLTESPYEDVEQARFCAHYPEAIVFTNDATSARDFGWRYLPPAYDETRHRPLVPQHAEDLSDVIFVGTGWPERVDWSGIKFRWIGPVVGGVERLPESLRPYHEDACCSNGRTVELYAATRIGLNLHRASERAWTPNPRAYELAACGVFQVADPRPGLLALFGDSLPTFENANELEQVLRYHLADDTERRLLAARQRSSILGETFDERVKVLLAAASR